MGLLDELKKILTPSQLQVAEDVLKAEEDAKVKAVAEDNAKREAEAQKSGVRELKARTPEPFYFQKYGKRVYRPDHPDFKKG